MNTALINAAMGKSASQGGLNIKDMLAYIRQYRDIDPNTRRAELNAILSEILHLGPIGPASAPVKQAVKQKVPKTPVARDPSVIKHLTDGSVMYYLVIDRNDRPAVDQTLQEIFLDDNIAEYIARGNSKIVYQYGQKEVFKIILTTKDRLSWMLREPLFMSTSPYTNRAHDITVYADGWVARCPVTVHDAPLGGAAIITWREERALYTDSDKFPPELMSAGVTYIEKTKPILESMGFTDLGNVNIGYFATKPHIRWIDVQPDPDDEAC